MQYCIIFRDYFHGLKVKVRAKCSLFLIPPIILRIKSFVWLGVNNTVSHSRTHSQTCLFSTVPFRNTLKLELLRETQKKPSSLP